LRWSTLETAEVSKADREIAVGPEIARFDHEWSPTQDHGEPVLSSGITERGRERSSERGVGSKGNETVCGPGRFVDRADPLQLDGPRGGCERRKGPIRTKAGKF
jgi:hypothetical protein